MGQHAAITKTGEKLFKMKWRTTRRKAGGQGVYNARPLQERKAPDLLAASVQARLWKGQLENKVFISVVDMLVWKTWVRGWGGVERGQGKKDALLSLLFVQWGI